MRCLIRGLVALWAGLCLSLAGCSPFRLGIQSKELLASAILAGRISSAHGAEAGAIVDLDDDLFSEKNGKRGYWTPRTVFERSGANIYFLEPYDPSRTPVLFVHGAAGTPQDWRYFIQHLDRSRFQPWLYSFPSGAGADALSDLLYWKLSNLQARFRFETLQIAAHSMGGLVVRSFLGKYHSRFPYVKLFVSLSTPWGGEELAKLSPVSIPAWNDMRPGGTFLASLFEKKLPAEIEFYLFFGYRGNRGLLRSENDGVVTLKSELNPSAQAEAQRVYGFAESHTSILTSQDVVNAWNALLSASSPIGSPSLVSTAK